MSYKPLEHDFWRLLLNAGDVTSCCDLSGFLTPSALIGYHRQGEGWSIIIYMGVVALYYRLWSS